MRFRLLSAKIALKSGQMGGTFQVYVGDPHEPRRNASQAEKMPKIGILRENLRVS